MLSYLNNPAVKAKYVQRFAEHRAMGAVIQGTGYENGRGCFIGCVLKEYNHAKFSNEIGPEWLARLADQIFEGLPEKEAPQFGTDLLNDIPDGVDLDEVRIPFLAALQRRNLARLKSNSEPYAEQCRAAIQGVIDFLSDPDQTESRRAAAESAAWLARSAVALSPGGRTGPATLELAVMSAAESVANPAESAESAAVAASELAVMSAAESVAKPAESARSAAAWAAKPAGLSASRAREAEFQAQRDDLLTIIRGCAKA